VLIYLVAFAPRSNKIASKRLTLLVPLLESSSYGGGRCC